LQIQTEIFKLETQLKEELEKEKLAEQIEVVIKQVQELEQKQGNLAKKVDIWKENYANQKALNNYYREGLVQKQTRIEELETEKANQANGKKIEAKVEILRNKIKN